MKRRRAGAWAAYWCTLAVVLCVMGFFTLRMLDLERSVARMQARASLEETVRLALWRMDSAAATLMPGAGDHGKVETARGNAGNTGAIPQPSPQQPSPQQRLEPQAQRQISQQEFQQRASLNRVEIREWRAIADDLLERIEDILPGATLEDAPVIDGKPPEDDPRRLATIPARLVVPAGAMAEIELPWNTPVRLALVGSWVSVLVAAAMVWFLLSARLALGERRAAFASAVTHELRTPLTTFRMYAEMLSSGMVNDPAARAEYLRTLVAESDRLSHLIENVLTYSRLENRAGSSRVETVSVQALLDAAMPMLKRRMEQAGQPLRVSLPPDAAGATCRADAVAVQQVLMNLIDNACKYAGTPVDVSVAVNAERVEITVADQGPGVGAAKTANAADAGNEHAHGIGSGASAPLSPPAPLFTAFSKRREDTVPGIGLGLYLSRQIARDMGGDLRHMASATGAVFTFVLIRS